MRIIFPIWQKLKKICKKLPIFRNLFPINTITQKELLDYCLKQAQQLAESQYIEIDSDYNLLENGVAIKPKIEINDSFERMVVIDIVYQIIPEHINIKKINMSKPKYVLRGKEIYKFDKVI
jgi:DTW domain-containing protein YfiP